MSYRKIYSFTLILFLSLLLMPHLSHAQITSATGNTGEASSQLVYYYDQSPELNDGGVSPESNTKIQITNTNDTVGVWVHVQIFRSFDPDLGDPAEPVLCDERNFTDFLTPNDTHVYDLGEENFHKNMGENSADKGEETAIDVGEDEATKGFVVITPVVSEADLSAIAFEHMIGTAYATEGGGNDYSYLFNAMGRHAVDFVSGETVADGTPLDGTTNGFVILRPEELLIDFDLDFDSEDDDFSDHVDLVGIAFNDVYGPPGLQGYTVTPANVSWTSFIFDFKEDPTSCGVRNISCFDTMGITPNLPQSNHEIDYAAWNIDEDGDLLCSGVEIPDYEDYYDDLGMDVNSDANLVGWIRIFISGLSDTANHLGVFVTESVDELDSARWMNTNKE